MWDIWSAFPSSRVKNQWLQSKAGLLSLWLVLHGWLTPLSCPFHGHLMHISAQGYYLELGKPFLYNLILCFILKQRIRGTAYCGCNAATNQKGF